jgi:hypothetical protein
LGNPSYPASALHGRFHQVKPAPPKPLARRQADDKKMQDRLKKLRDMLKDPDNNFNSDDFGTRQKASKEFKDALDEFGKDKDFRRQVDEMLKERMAELDRDGMRPETDKTEERTRLNQVRNSFPGAKAADAIREAQGIVNANKSFELTDKDMLDQAKKSLQKAQKALDGVQDPTRGQREMEKAVKTMLERIQSAQLLGPDTYFTKEEFFKATQDSLDQYRDTGEVRPK